VLVELGLADRVDGDTTTRRTRGARAEEREAMTQREAEALSGDATA
jgi:hypothetical protein